jgi:dihydrofolate synthase/folylpolyglutamate synthase
MNYDEAMSYIKNTAKFGSNYGLSRTEKILDLLGNPHKKLKCIHIGGTNGKGSTTAMLNAILMEAGFKTGMYISPFIEEFEERIQINGKNISKEHLCSIVTEVSQAVDEVVRLGFEHPTEFEIITCAMFLYFYRMQVDYAIIEVGLGGRLDSTNVINPILSIITSISYDHMHILGDTLEKIAGEKAGIIKEGVPLILYPQEDESLKVIEERCKEKNSPIIKVARDCVNLFQVTNKSNGDYIQRIVIKTKECDYNVNLSLLGKHQLLNCATVIYAVEQLKSMDIEIKSRHITLALEKVKWPGRMEVMSVDPLVVIDGAHNIDGIKKLTESIDIYFSYNNLVLILGILADKQVEQMVETIVPKAKKIIAVTPNSDRAELGAELAEVIKKYNSNVEVIEGYSDAFKTGIKNCSSEDLLLVCGSLYMIGGMRGIIKESN